MARTSMIRRNNGSKKEREVRDTFEVFDACEKLTAYARQE
jgi:hypothetical protein